MWKGLTLERGSGKSSVRQHKTHFLVVVVVGLLEAGEKQELYQAQVVDMYLLEPLAGTVLPKIG